MPTPTLHSALRDLAFNFASAVLASIQTASLDELMASAGRPATQVRQGPGRPRGPAASRPSGALPRPKRAPAGKLARRSPEAIAKAVAGIVALVKKHKEGLRSEQIRAELGMRANEMPRVLADGLAKNVPTSKGKKRGTRYFSK